MKRLVSVFMALAILFTSAAAEFPITAVTAHAATNGVQSQIDKLKAVYPNGSYFSVSGGACNNNEHKTEYSCGNCSLRSIPSRGGLPAGSAIGLGDWWSCAAFAVYAYYNIFGHNHTMKTSQVSSPSPGDLIHMYWKGGGQHWFIYLSEDSSNYYVYDANYGNTQMVRYNAAIAKSQISYFSEIYHATDYSSVQPAEDITYTNITPGSYYFLNKGTGLALNLDHNTDANLQNMHMYQYSPGYTTQQMVISLRSSSDKSYKIRPTISQRLIQTYGDYGVTTSGMNVNIYDDVNDNTQWWHFQAVSGGYVIRNAANTTCALTASNGNAIVSTYTGSANQIWTLQSISTATTQKYTITYNANGGSGTMANTEMTVGTAANLRANAFTRTGYTFLGWSTSASATTATYTDKQSVKDLAKSGTVTLYAVWKATGTANGVQSQIDKLKAVYPNGSYFSVSGGACNNNEHKTEYSCGNCSLRSIPSRGGLPAGSAIGLGDWWSCAAFAVYAYYNIFGHNHTVKTSQVSSPSPGDLIHMYWKSGGQHWFIYLGEDSSNYYVYDANYGNTQMVRYNAAIAKSQISYFSEIYHATDYSSVQPAAQKYTIAYNANGGSGTMANTEMTVGTAANLRANAFTRTGYTFLGWSTSASATTAIYTDKQSVKDLAKSGPVTLYAVWKANSYTIAYNANGGSGTMANTEMTVGTAANLRANAFTRTGYTFLGWSTSASATTATYTDKQSVKDLAKSGTVTLYAVWKANSYTIAYNANGGSGTMANTAMTYGTAANLRANAFTRTGYTFLGWSTSASAATATYTDKQSVKDLAGSATSVALYAVWKANPVSTYTIKYDGNGNTSGYMNDTKATYNTSVNLQKNTYENFGSRFKGWSTNKNATATQYTDGQSVKNLAQSGTVTLYAVWEHIEVPQLTGIKVTMVTADSITLSWDIIDVDGYNIWKDDEYFDRVTSNSITFTGLKPTTTYSFDVMPYIEGASYSIGSGITVTTLSGFETAAGAAGAASLKNPSTSKSDTTSGKSNSSLDTQSSSKLEAADKPSVSSSSGNAASSSSSANSGSQTSTSKPSSSTSGGSSANSGSQISTSKSSGITSSGSSTDLSNQTSVSKTNTETSTPEIKTDEPAAAPGNSNDRDNCESISTTPSDAENNQNANIGNTGETVAENTSQVSTGDNSSESNNAAQTAGLGAVISSSICALVHFLKKLFRK